MIGPIRILVVVPLFALAISGCGSTLHKAVESGDAEAVKQAIENGDSVDTSFWAGSPLNPAITNNDLEIVTLLHEKGAQILPAHLSVAVQASALSTYDYLHANGAELNDCYLDQNYPGWWGENSNVGSFIPPLGSAIMRADVRSVGQLLQLGAPIQTPCNASFGQGEDWIFSAILVAGFAGDPDIIEMLIAKGAEPNRLNVNGRTPLSLAAERGHYEAARVLLANGAFHTYTTDIKQPIEYADDAGNENVVNLLVYAGAVRPKRKDPSAVLANIGNAVLEGVKFAAEMYVIYLGARYSDYDPAYTARLQDTNDTTTASTRRDFDEDDDNSCRSDYDSGAGNICAKDYASFRGTSVRDEFGSGWQPESRGLGPTNRGPDPAYRGIGVDACRSGYTRDLIYGGCKR